MKRYIISIMAIAALAACTDDWDVHYAEDKSVEGTLWDALKTRSEVSNFCKVLEATGYDERLKSSQMFAVFAPTNENFAIEVADGWIVRHQEEKARGVREEDNTVIKQFIQNHLSLSNISVSSLTNEQLTLMNGKYETLTAQKFGESNILTSNQYAGNGVLYTIDRPEEYFPNVYEYIGMNGQTDSMYAFLSLYDEYEFDPEESVAGDIVDGKTVYLDSVFHLRNVLINEYGHINREDSSYMALVPTDAVWKKLYEEYVNYFNYNNLTEKRDSMVRTFTRRAIADGTIFNQNMQLSLQDSAISTKYEELYTGKVGNNEPRYYAYYRPYDMGGIFDGSVGTVCSNGSVMVQNDWKMDKRLTFYQQIKVEAEDNEYVDTIIQAKEPLSVRAVPMDNPFYGRVSENHFMEAQNLTSASSTSVTFAIPDNLSNIGYDILAVFVPAIAYNEQAAAEDRLPCRVRFTLGYTEQDGTEKTATLRNPIDNAVNFTTVPDVIDTLVVATDYKFPTCAYGLEEPQVTLRVASNLTSSMSSKYTRVLRMDCIILKPHVAN